MILGIQRTRCLFPSISSSSKQGQGHSQSPSGRSLLIRRVNSLSRKDDMGANRFELDPSSVSCVGKSKRVSKPATVGKKNGARSGALGASFGLLRCCHVSLTDHGS